MSPMESEEESIESQDRLWTIYDAARYVGVHVQTIRKWVRLGRFPRIPLPGKGKDFRFTRELIDEWVKNRALGVRPK
jgi:excisionase family DNA binding protein